MLKVANEFYIFIHEIMLIIYNRCMADAANCNKSIVDIRYMEWKSALQS